MYSPICMMGVDGRRENTWGDTDGSEGKTPADASTGTVLDGVKTARRVS